MAFVVRWVQADDGNDLLYPRPPSLPIFDNPEFDDSFRYLNSGTYMGDRDALLHLLNFYANTWEFKCYSAVVRSAVQCSAVPATSGVASSFSSSS